MRLFEGTEFDRPPRCQTCEELEENCVCPPPEIPRTPPEKQTAKLAIEKRKKGKAVTVIRGLLDEGDALPELLTALKSQCGAGGTLTDGNLEIQGRQLDRVREVLQSLGYKTKG